MYVVYWERSLHKASWKNQSDDTTGVVGVVEGGMDEIVSYMDPIVEDDIKTKLNNWNICYTNVNMNPKKLTLTILRRSKDDKNIMLTRYTAVKVD